MSRKNIYDLLEEKAIEPKKEYARLCFLLMNSYYDSHSRITFYEHIRKETFHSLPTKIKGTCVNLDDLLGELRIDLSRSSDSMDKLFDLIEFIICVIDSEDSSYKRNRYATLANNIGIILEKTSHKTIKYKNGIIVMPKDAVVEEASAVAKDENTSLEFLSYSHRSNIGNIENKTKILSTIAKAYEQELKSDKGQLSNDIRFLLNNFNIRHDNKNGNNTIFIQNMDENTLEEWYDKLYTLLIAFIVQSEQKRISSEIRELKNNGNS